ncbi:preprotein translocase subunit SecG [Candidatus Magnetomoraceae bacterium gMMP-15]
MSVFVVIIHIIVSLALIMIVLLQTGKGADMGVAFGGGSSQTLFGSSGASTFLSKATTIMAVIFMLTSFALTYMWGHSDGDSIMSKNIAPPIQMETGVDESGEQQPLKEEASVKQQTSSESPVQSNVDLDKVDLPAEVESPPDID